MCNRNRLKVYGLAYIHILFEMYIKIFRRVCVYVFVYCIMMDIISIYYSANTCSHLLSAYIVYIPMKNTLLLLLALPLIFFFIAAVGI